jgi:hypothetical protein
MVEKIAVGAIGPNRRRVGTMSTRETARSSAWIDDNYHAYRLDFNRDQRDSA